MKKMTVIPLLRCRLCGSTELNTVLDLGVMALTGTFPNAGESMPFDLPNPLEFMREIRDVLADDGIWVFEQSYLPAMPQTNSFDTVCHEHLEYYGLGQIAWATARAGFDLLDVSFNDVNGGSFPDVAWRFPYRN